MNIVVIIGILIGVGCMTPSVLKKLKYNKYSYAVKATYLGYDVEEEDENGISKRITLKFKYRIFEKEYETKTQKSYILSVTQFESFFSKNGLVEGEEKLVYINPMYPTDISLVGGAKIINVPFIAGAAIATNISKFIQAGIVVIYTHTHAAEHTYITGIYKNFRVPVAISKKILAMATPLVVNETMWAAGIAVQTQIYSSRGLSVVAALNINSTINNVFNIAFIAMGDAVAIIVGQLLGAGKFEEGKNTAYKIITFSTLMCIGIGIILYVFAPYFPLIYNTSNEVQDLACGLIKVSAITMPINGFLHSTYFTIRSGGKTVITFLFDSVFLWVVSVPIAFLLTHNTGLIIVFVFLLTELTNSIKAIIGWLIMRSGIWIQNIVNE